MTKEPQIKVGVYFACFGSWSQALKNIGITPTWHIQPNIANPIETDKLSKAILKMNFPDVPVEMSKNIDFLCGSPPCIGMSKGNPKANPDHWANRNFVKFYQAVYDYQPRAFLMEIVPQIFTHGAKLVKEALDLVKDDYEVSNHVFEVSEYGSPAKRERAYFFGIHKELSDIPLEVKDFVSKRPLLSCSKVLAPLKEKWDNYKPDRRMLFPRCKPNGEQYAGPFSCLSKSNRKLDPDKPAYTITGTTYENVIHYDKDRFLSVEEIETLLGFPLTYKWLPPGRKFGAQMYSKLIASGVDVNFTAQLLKVATDWAVRPDGYTPEDFARDTKMPIEPTVFPTGLFDDIQGG